MASNNNLLTPKSLALSLSAPRAPPHDSAHRKLLQGKDPRKASLALHHNKDDNIEYRQTRGYTEHRLAEMMYHSHRRHHARASHPHLELIPSFDNRITRYLGSRLPVSLWNKIRDSGSFRLIFDNLVALTAPIAAITKPHAAKEFLDLSWRCNRISYGQHPMQMIDLILPKSPCQPNGLLFFVHGGAWGSGLPWFYRLAASPFLESPFHLAVAIVGYRTYPDADTVGQVSDLEQAAQYLYQHHPDLCGATQKLSVGTCVLGHSSGAHIALLMIVDRAIRQRHTSSTQISKRLEIDSFIGLSGPYSICHHFDFEAARGVEEFSPMKAACGHSREAFRQNSPALRLMSRGFPVLGSERDLIPIEACLPPIALVHGTEDATVPFTATAEAARVLRSCGATQLCEIYLAHVGHQEAIMQIMFGGPTRDAVVGWLSTLLQGTAVSSNNLIVPSKL